MLNTIDDLNWNGSLHENSLMVSFNVVNMFPSFSNKIVIESVKNILLNRHNNIPPADCIIEALVWIVTTQFLTTNIIYR